jgi:septum formation protein
VSTFGTPRLILASASPRRSELLATIYPAFDVQPCPYEEPVRKSPRVSPTAWVQALAYFKARGVAEHWPERWVLAADTIVVCDGELLGKPRDEADARRMLELQGRQVSEVLTGVCLLHNGLGERRTLVDITRVWMQNDAREREAYLRGGDWAGKAGAYGLQTVGDRLVSRIEGSYSNVVGLPLERLTELLCAAGLPVTPAA